MSESACTRSCVNQFLLVVKATTLKLQISKFYLQILSTETSFYIYNRPQTDINVIARIHVLNVDKILIFAILLQWLLQ